MGRGVLCFLAAMLLFSGTANAAPLSQGVLAPAIGIALIALTVSLDVVAVGYIISKLFPEIGIEKWLGGEYWEIAKSAMLIVGIYSAVVFIGNISSSLILPPSGSCPNYPAQTTGVEYSLVNGACGYLSQVSASLGSTYTYLFGLSATLGALSTLDIGAYTPIPAIVVGFEFGFDLKPYQNKLLESASSDLDEMESILNDALALVAFPVTILIDGQLNLLPFIYVLGLEVFLPMGLVLRAMPFVRGIGGTLVAMGIGISLIYPSVLILFNYPITTTLAGTLITPSSNQFGCSIPIICNVLSFIINTISPGLVSTGDALAGLFTIMPALNNIVNQTTYLLLQFVLFILDLAIALPLTNSIAGMLGGSIELSITDKIKFL